MEIKPALPKGWLPVNPFFAMLHASAQLWSMPTTTLRRTFGQQIELVDYALALVETGTPSAWRQLPRPRLQFDRPPAPVRLSNARRAYTWPSLETRALRLRREDGKAISQDFSSSPAGSTTEPFIQLIAKAQGCVVGSSSDSGYVSSGKSGDEERRSDGGQDGQDEGQDGHEEEAADSEEEAEPQAAEEDKAPQESEVADENADELVEELMDLLRDSADVRDALSRLRTAGVEGIDPFLAAAFDALPLATTA